MNQKLLAACFFVVVVLSLGSCSSSPKCPDATLLNPVYDKGTCKVRTRNVYVADLLSPELKGKFRDNPNVTAQWVSTVNENGTIIPGHFVIINATGKGSK